MVMVNFDIIGWWLIIAMSKVQLTYSEFDNASTYNSMYNVSLLGVGDKRISKFDEVMLVLGRLTSWNQTSYLT